MKVLTAVLSITIFAVVLPLGVTPASADRMNGRCCMSSDGGRSYRYRMALRRMALRRAPIPHTCSAHADWCIRSSDAGEDRTPTCQAAKAQCLQTGVYVGPYSGRILAGMQRL
jgi:hypothetical protein